MKTYKYDDITALMTNHGSYADGVVARMGVTVDTIVHAPHVDGEIEDYVEECAPPYSLMVFSVMILGRLSPLFIDVQNALDWVEELFNLSTEQVF